MDQYFKIRFNMERKRGNKWKPQKSRFFTFHGQIYEFSLNTINKTGQNREFLSHTVQHKVPYKIGSFEYYSSLTLWDLFNIKTSLPYLNDN